MMADAEINVLKPENPPEDSVDGNLADGGELDLQTSLAGVDQSPILEVGNGEERDLGEKAVGIDGACRNAQVKENGGLRGDSGSEKVESCDPVQMGSESDREAKPEVGVSAVPGGKVEEEKEAVGIVGEVEEPVALEEEKGEEGEKLGKDTEFLDEETKEKENVVAEEIDGDELGDNSEAVVVGDAKLPESMVAEKGSDEAMESPEVAVEEAKEAEHIVEGALESEDLVAEKGVKEVSEIHESMNVDAETSSEEVMKSHDLLIEEAPEPKYVFAEVSSEEISKSGDLVIDEAPESTGVVAEGGSDAAGISIEEVVITESPASENVLAEMDSDERVSEEKVGDAPESNNVETSRELISEGPEPVIEEVVELKDVTAEQGNEEVTKAEELIAEEASESENVVVGSGSEQVSEGTAGLMIKEEPESETVVTKTTSEEVELMKKQDVVVDENKAYGQDDQEEPGLGSNVDNAVAEAAKVEERVHPEVLVSVNEISESIVVKLEEALSTDVAEQTQKVDAFDEKDDTADQVQKDETLGQNGPPAVETQANEASLENGTDAVASDVVLGENWVAQDLKMEAGSEVYENGHATLSVDEKQDDHVAANGSEVSTCTDTDEAELHASKDNDDKHSSKEPISVKETEKVDTQVAKPQTYWLAKISWYLDSELAAKIKHAQSQRAELTTAKNKIHKEIREQREIVNKCKELLDAAKGAEKAAKEAVNEKNKVIEAVQLKISNLRDDLNNVNLIAGIDTQIASLEWTIQHETIPLKEEKTSLEKIKKLKERREKLSSGMDPEMQIEEAFDLKNQISASLKDLSKELDPLRFEMKQAEKKRVDASEKYTKERQCLNELKQKAERVEEDRQAAYWLEMKLNSENKHFNEFKVDKATATKYLASGDQRIACHCNNQVEKVMTLWNTNSKFRKQYVESNVRSTLYRLKTLDGRSLAPGERAPPMPSIVAMGSANVMPSSNNNTSEPVSAQKHEKEEVNAITKMEKKDSSATSNLLQKNQPVSVRKITKLTSEETAVTVLDSKEVEDDKVERKLTKEEEEIMRKTEELARKEEELRKAKREAELKERLREEQKAKAKEAEERKRKQAEKAQARAELRAQKEAELKDKKKAKKEQKKRKAAATAAAKPTDENVEGDTAPNTKSTAPETVNEPEIKVTTMSKKPPLTKKYNKMEPIPLPLRNRNRRKMKSLMLKGLGITALILVIVFCLYKFLPSSHSSQTNLGY